MIYDEKKLLQALKTIDDYTTLYFYSTEEFLLRNAVSKTIKMASQNGEPEITTLDGTPLDIELLNSIIGTISFLGERRIIIIEKLDTSAISDTDLADFFTLLDTAQDVLVIVTTLFADDRSKTTKKAKLLQEKSEEKGISADFVVPSQKDIYELLSQTAQNLGTEITPQAVTKLIEVCGTDMLRLENEIAKLAALSDYTQINPEHIDRISTKNIDADVFQMIGFITEDRPQKAFEKLAQLIYLQNEPIAICAAVAGSYVDMYRAKCGAENGKSYQQVFKDMGYKGNDYRLKMALKNAGRYTKPQLATAISTLKQLDTELKSTAVDNTVLLQTAIASIISISKRG